MVTWETMANPFKRDEDMASLINGLVLAGLDYRPDRRGEAGGHPMEASPNLAANTFKHGNGLWEITYDRKTVQLPEVKGFHDLARLLVSPGKEVHCTVMMGNPDSMSDDSAVLDDKAMESYRQRIRDLQEEIRDAEGMNDLGRAEKAAVELDQITEHLTKVLGLGGRARKLNPSAERARAAVTWRIRSAIKKVQAAHPSLGRHLSNAIRTGTFCSYHPESDQAWHS